MTPTTRDDDLSVLNLLDLRDHEGLTSTQIAARTGKTRSAVMGALHRVDRARDPEAIQEGTMPRRWWK